MVLRVADDGGPTTVREDNLALGHGVDGVVGALAVHVRTQGMEQRTDRRPGEDHHVVDASHRGHELRAIVSRHDRPTLVPSTRVTDPSSFTATTRRSASARRPRRYRT